MDIVFARLDKGNMGSLDHKEFTLLVKTACPTIGTVAPLKTVVENVWGAIKKCGAVQKGQRIEKAELQAWIFG